MSSQKKQRKGSRVQQAGRAESDGQYLLKLVLVILLGTVWLKFGSIQQFGAVPVAGIPLGALCGFLVVSRFEHMQTDRKIWYAVLVVATIVSYFLPAGIVL